MFSLIKGAVWGFFMGLWTLLLVASVGAVAGIGAWVAGRLLGPLAAAGVASVIVLGAYYGGLASWVADREALAAIERLERANRELDRARRAAENVAAFERSQAASQIAAAEERERKLNAALSLLDDECGLSEKELEAIKELDR